VARVLAWLGGAFFVASLAYTVYFYAVLLGDPQPAHAVTLARATVLNTVLFGVFAAHHSVFAREAVKRWMARVIPPQMERSCYVWVASLLLVLVCMLWQLVAGTVYVAEGAVRWLFYALQLLGVHLTMRAAGFIDPFELAGIRQAQRQDAVVFRTDGPFGLVRHPIYLGWLLMTFATPTMTINRLLFAVISSAYLVVAIPWEERSLAAAFGDRYRAYQAIVRWRLIPGLW
jgi:protein-S-isoprenylcysteine O-methyltransferase Ste14